LVVLAGEEAEFVDGGGGDEDLFGRLGELVGGFLLFYGVLQVFFYFVEEDVEGVEVAL
jgi:hypothetical protein